MASNNKITTTIKPLTVVGLISGTSMDGIDAIVETISIEGGKPNFTPHIAETIPYKDKKLIEELRKVELGKDITGTEFDRRVANEFSNAALSIIKKSDLSPKNIDFIASHGQTVWYIPKTKNQKTKACIIGDGCLIAQQTKIKTIYDFRTADIEAGGLGAPLAPILHFYKFPAASIVLNIGGIANLTAIGTPPDINKLIAFDTGPGNFLIDELVRIFSKDKEAYDSNGSWSAKGTPNIEIVNELLKNDYFSKPFPKATDRKLFNPELIQKLLKLREQKKLNKYDAVATAVLLTAKSIAFAYNKFLRHPEHSEGSYNKLIVVGGGRLNPTLMKQLVIELPMLDVMTSENLKINGDYIEAELMAFLGFLTANGVPGNIPHITGAKRKVVLGKVIEPS